MTEPGLALLLRTLAHYRRQKKPWPFWLALCPCHEDVTPSLRVEYRSPRNDPEAPPTVLAHCRNCDKSLPAVCKALGLKTWDVLQNNEQWNDEIMGEPPPPAPLPFPASLMACRKTLSVLPDQLDYLRNQRGLRDKTIEWAWIGWDLRLRRYTFPIYSDGELVNVRYYKPNPARDEAKWICVRDHSVKYLYPKVPKRSWVLLCEGELDTLLARQKGLPAVGVSGVATWDSNWNPVFAGRFVAICFDCDDDGRSYAHRRARELSAAGARVKVIDLGLGDKEDITDWFITYRRTADDLRELIKRTPK